VVLCLDEAAWRALDGYLMTMGKCEFGLLGGHTKKKERTAVRGEKGGISWGFVKKVSFSFSLQRKQKQIFLKCLKSKLMQIST